MKIVYEMVPPKPVYFFLRMVLMDWSKFIVDREFQSRGSLLK